MTRKQCRSKIAYKLQDPALTKVADIDIVDSFIDDARYWLVDKTYCLYSKFSRRLTADQTQYNIRSIGGTNKDKALKILCVLWKDSDGKYYPLEPISEYELDKNHSSWRTDSSSTPRYAAIDGHWLTIFPAYTASVTAGIWVITIRRPDELTGDDDDLGIPSEYNRFIIDYVFNTMTNKDANNEVLAEQVLKRLRAKTMTRLARTFDIKSGAISRFTN